MSKQLTLGSLFDGIGGFPLAGMLSSVKPVWASEIEPFPIRVTTIRFPDMKHYGDIHNLNGGELEPVDIITFGSPCTDLSVAGRRSGLGGKQSSLFFEAIRVITEMREKTNGTKPRWLVWENVPGAMSSSHGNDYQIVLESLVQIKDPQATVPMPETGRWLSAGEIQGCASTLGDDYSLAWRIIDAAKGWGVAQRRRHIFVVVDLDGACAGKVLFESEGVSGYTPPSGQTREEIAGGAEACAAKAERTVLNDQGGQCMTVLEDEACTLRAKANGHAPCVLAGGFCTEHSANSRGVGYEGERSPTLRAGVVPGVAIEYNPTDSRVMIKEDGICQTLTSRMGAGGNTVPLTLKIRSGCDGGGKGAIWQVNRSATLGCNNDQTLFVPKAYGISSDQSNAMLSDNPHSGIYEADTSRTLDCMGGSPACNQGGIAVVEPIAFCANQRDEVRNLNNLSGTLAASPGVKQQIYVAAFMGGQGEKAGGLGYREEQSPTLKSAPSGGNTVPDVVYALQGNMIGRKDENGPQGAGVNEEVCFTLTAVDRPAVAAPSYCMTVGSFGQIGEEKTPTLEARGYKDPPVVGKPSEAERPVCPPKRPPAMLASGKEQAGTLTSRAASQKAFLGNQEAFSGDYFVLEEGRNHPQGEQPACLPDPAAFNQSENALLGNSIKEEQSQTLTAQDRNAVAQLETIDYIVRRLTPGKCCRLQGYPDGWTENLGTEEPTDAELRWWAGVFEDWYRAQGKTTRPPSEARLCKWLKDPRTDSAEYKALGNSVAIPCVFFVLAGIVWAAGLEG